MDNTTISSTIVNQKNNNVQNADITPIGDAVEAVLEVGTEIPEAVDSIGDLADGAGAIVDEAGEVAGGLVDGFGDLLDGIDDLPILAIVATIGGAILVIVGIVTGIIKLVKHFKNK